MFTEFLVVTVILETSNDCVKYKLVLRFLMKYFKIEQQNIFYKNINPVTNESLVFLFGHTISGDLREI